MTIYKVTYNRKNMDKFFGGSNEYYDETERFFSTEEKANEFVTNEEIEYVPTWRRNVSVKEANEGKIELITVE